MLKKLLISLFFSLIFFAVTATAQKTKTEPETEEQPSKVEREAPREEPRREEPRREEPRREEPRREEPKSEPRREEPRQSTGSSNESSIRTEARRERSEKIERNERRERDLNSDDVARPRRPRDSGDNAATRTHPRKHENPPEVPVENPDTAVPVPNPRPSPNPVPNPTQPPNNSGNNHGDNRDRDKHRDRDRNRRHRDRDVVYYPPIYYPTTPTPMPPRIFSINEYFDEDDVFFNIYNSTIETDSSKYLPFFEDALSEALSPLYYTYGREFYVNEFRFVASDWSVYYEPDLDDVYINLAKFAPVKFERMIWYPIGETVKKVSRKFNYKGNLLRPVLVEKIPEIGQDKLYSFSVRDLPKGEYEMRLIARNGTTVKHFLRIK